MQLSTQLWLAQSCKFNEADKHEPEPESISPNPKNDLKFKPGSKSPKICLDLKMFMFIAWTKTKTADKLWSNTIVVVYK